MHSPDKNEPKKMSSQKKALMALTASGILLWKGGDNIKQLFRNLNGQDIARADQELQQGEDDPDILDYIPLAPSSVHNEDDPASVMYGSGLQKYRPSMHSPDKNEPKKMSNRKKALMALTASGILLWRHRDKLHGLIRPHQLYQGLPPGYGDIAVQREYADDPFAEDDDPFANEENNPFHGEEPHSIVDIEPEYLSIDFNVD